MNVGIGDVVLVTEKSIRIYTKCKNAGKDYQALAKSVDILRGILDNADAYLKEESLHVPDRLGSLLTARSACDAVLNDVDKLLDKYTSLREGSSIRFIHRMKFAAQDIDELKTRLDTSGSLVQQSLSPLMSLSLSDLRVTVKDLFAEYRAGKHEPSVLSVALVANRKIEEEAAMVQVEKDLLDKNVHPDAVDVHHEEIWRWICNSIPEEATLDTRDDSNDGHHLAVRQQSTHGNSTSTTLDRSASRSKGQDRPREERVVPGSSALSKEILTQPDEDSDDDLYKSSVVARPHGTYFLRPINDNHVDLLPPLSEAPSSRRSSMGSHTSQDSA